MRYLARGPIFAAEALTEDPWTGCPVLIPMPHPNPNLTFNRIRTFNSEVRWVVDGFNANRKANFRPGWGYPIPNPNPNPNPNSNLKPNPTRIALTLTLTVTLTVTLTLTLPLIKPYPRSNG